MLEGSGRLVWIIGAALLATALVLVGVLVGHQGSTSRDAPRVAGNGSGTGASRGTGDPSGTDVEASRTAARAYALIAGSMNEKARIQVAAQELNSCDQLAAAASTFRDAAASRQDLIDQAAAMDTSALPELAPVLDALEQAWRYSAEADAAFVQAADVRPCGSSSPAIARAAQLSTASHPYKNRAATLWNRIASDYSLPTVAGSAL